MPVTPYNTGKIKIGCHYIKPQVNMNTSETEFWQGVYLGDRAHERRASIRFWVVCCIVAAICFSVYAFRGAIII